MLSFYELLMYGLGFVLIIYIYSKCYTIPTREFYVNAERIDDFSGDSIFNDVGFLSINYNFNMTKFYKSSLNKNYVIGIESQKIIDELNQMHDVIGSKRNEKRYYVESKEIKDTIGVTPIANIKGENYKWENCHLDFSGDSSIISLRDLYKSSFIKSDIELNHPIFFIETKAKGLISKKSKYILTKDSIDINKHTILHNYAIRENDTLTIVNKTFGPLGIQIDSQEDRPGGVFSKPKFTSLYDISQCYYHFRIKSNTLPLGKIKISFQGANDIYVIKGNPDSISKQSVVFNTLPKGDIILFAKSKDLENLQNYRMFFLSTLLSALITIFLAFIVIFIYRLFRNIQKISKHDDSDNENSLLLP